MKGSLISVIIPVYKKRELLKKALGSVFLQTYTKIEVIVVDDGSEEDIGSLISDLNHSNLAYYKLPHKNANVARNFGIQKSNGDYIAMLDSDDLRLPNHIQDCLNTIKEQTVIARLPFERESIETYIIKSGFGAQTSTLFMTSIAAKAILWDEQLFRHQDYDFVIRLFKKYSIGVKEKPTVIYTSSPSTLKQIHFESCITFLHRYRKYISPIVYNKYCYNMYKISCNQNAELKIKYFYKKGSNRNKEYITYYDYAIKVFSGSFLRNLKYKLAYI